MQIGCMHLVYYCFIKIKMIKQLEFQQTIQSSLADDNYTLPILLGTTEQGDYHIEDLIKMPHVHITGGSLAENRMCQQTSNFYEHNANRKTG